ncbi:hypothetical protein LMG28140_06656 [Paraburkholderia metrosideri]|uniref:Uncharacterized protein n=1 Tax=Paraburkholderia metrosideri TaxID=580937 RepID=A0ABM8P906_9BURK|nr:hypothetical protein LMG28140_06656 [Paraburkholderia metrosideri]
MIPCEKDGSNVCHSAMEAPSDRTFVCDSQDRGLTTFLRLVTTRLGLTTHSTSLFRRSLRRSVILRNVELRMRSPTE